MMSQFICFIQKLINRSLNRYLFLIEICCLSSLLLILSGQPDLFNSKVLAQELKNTNTSIIIEETTKSQPNIQQEQIQLVNSALEEKKIKSESISSDKKYKSIFDAQADLIYKVRRFYGGENETGYPGTVAIFILTIGPLKIIPAFAKLTVNADEKLRRQLAFRAFLISSVTVLISSLLGQNLLVKYNIPLTAVVATAGILLFLIALRPLLSQYDDNESSSPPPANPSLKLAIQPLTFPTILTPYGIAVVITLSAVASEMNENLYKLMLLLFIIMFVNLLAMLFARSILKILKPQILQVIGLVLGVIQLSLGIGLIFSAIELQALAIKELLLL